MKYTVNSTFLVLLCMSFCGSLESATPISYHFENNTKEDVPLGVVFKDSKGMKSRTLDLPAGKKETVVFEGCIDHIVVPIPAELAMRGQGFQSKFKPSSKLSCKSMTTGIYQKADGSFEINFVYQ